MIVRAQTNKSLCHQNTARATSAVYIFSGIRLPDFRERAPEIAAENEFNLRRGIAAAE